MNNYKYNILKYQAESSSNAMAKYLLYIIWPFAAWLVSLRTPGTRSSYVIFFLFSLLVGWHMSPIGDVYDDFKGILEEFQQNGINTTIFLRSIKEYFTFEIGAPKELYQIFLDWITNEFFNSNYHFMFLLAAIPLAYCQLQSLKYITCDRKFDNAWVAIAIVIMFIYPRDIVTVQNPRFTTGFWICVLSTICFFAKKKWLYALPVLISPVFHSGFVPYVVFFTIGIICSRIKKPLEIFAMVSILFMFFDAGFFKDISFEVFPDSMSLWIQGYFSDDAYGMYVLHDDASGYFWVTEWNGIAMKLFYAFLTLTMIFKKEELFLNPHAKAMYSYYLLLFAVINFIQFIPVVGERYYYFTRVFCIFMWFKAFYPKYNVRLYPLMATFLIPMFLRYGYIKGGALSVTTPLDLFITPLPYLMGKGLLW